MDRSNRLACGYSSVSWSGHAETSRAADTTRARLRQVSVSVALIGPKLSALWRQIHNVTAQAKGIWDGIIRLEFSLIIKIFQTSTPTSNLFPAAFSATQAFRVNFEMSENLYLHPSSRSSPKRGRNDAQSSHPRTPGSSSRGSSPYRELYQWEEKPEEDLIQLDSANNLTSNFQTS